MTVSSPQDGKADDLIARLQDATGPSFALDAEITRLSLPSEYFGSKVLDWFQAGQWFGCNTEDGYRHLEAVRVATYTTSIDTARTLVPEGWEWQVSNRAPKPHTGRAYLNNRELQFRGGGGMQRNPGYRGEECTAANPAIALSIAALKASSQLHKRDEE